MLIFSFFLFTFLFSNVKMYIINTQKKRGIVMKISKSLKRKRRADARTVGIVICIIVIIAALVVVFWPTNTTKNTQESQVASQNTNTNTNSNNTQVAKQNTNTIANTLVNDIATNTIADNSITNTTTNVTTNTATVTTNSNKVQNTTANTNTNTTNNNQTTSQTNQQTQTNTNTTNVNFEVINWGKGQIDENRAKEMAVAQFEKLGETTTKDQLQVYPLERNDGKYYFYIKSSKNTCEIRKEDGTITRVNAKVVNQ